ncbi:pullulanase-type alpha-1,6-glucosidase [Colwelliaceae bacterium BS250]
MFKLGSIITLMFTLVACLDKDNASTTQHLPAANVSEATASRSAHWLARDLFILMNSVATNEQHYLLARSSKSAETKKPISLEIKELSDEMAVKYSYLSVKSQVLSFSKPLTDAQIQSLLKQQLMIVSVDQNTGKQRITGVQTGDVIDDFFAEFAMQETEFGAIINNDVSQFKLWAPTALSVQVLLFNEDKSPYQIQSLLLTEQPKSGIWQGELPQNLASKYYQYKVQVFHPATQNIETIVTTDPYSLSLSVNSEYSQIVNLNNQNSKPTDWDEQVVPTIGHYEDNVFYELHIGDFSANDNSIETADVKGKYQAFSEQKSAGISHLKRLKSAGLNNIHLLPTFDLGTINEEVSQRLALTDTVTKLCSIDAKHALCQTPENLTKTLIEILQSYDPKSANAQQLVSQIREYDDYNWGYDPFHYTVPEGSYAQNPEGLARIVEFRRMVQSLHNLGFRVIMDVVYNHTHQAGLNRTSVLDKIVPGYYQRLNPITGLIEQSTCCDNTATERVMMAKLMTDSLVVWARDYKIDGFRFDLMAHQPKALMLTAREAVREVDADTYFYGEGWNFGEVANNQRFVQASQLELGGTEIGTFTDRLRDAVRGGGMTESGDEIRKLQGIGNGLYTMPNELRSKADSQEQYLLLADILRVGLAGNLANFPLTNAHNKQVTGKDIPYGDQPAGYALDPADTINYVSKHDNQTLWDNNQYRNDFDLSIDDRVRMQILSLSYSLLAQGIPFLHMGSELLRSKSYLRDSYDYGHWYNKVDFSQQSNNYNVGLPPAEKDQQNWPVIRKILINNAGKDTPSKAHIGFSKDRFLEFLTIRMSSPLFRLTTAEAINEQVKFHNTGSDQQMGLIVMSLTDNHKIDNNHQQIVVIFNSSAEQQTFRFANAEKFKLHPVQAASSDPLITTALANERGFTVNKFSTTVFVK